MVSPGDVKDRQVSRTPRVYILPTKQGMLLGLVLWVMLIGSINYSLSLGYVLTFLLGGLLLVCMLHTNRNISRLNFAGAKVSPVFAGEIAEFNVGVDNRRGPFRYAIEILRYSKTKKRLKRLDGPASVIDVPQDKLDFFPLPVAAPERGRLTLGWLRTTTCFPLGLFRAWNSINIPTSCIVYPRPEGSPVLPEHAASGSFGHGGSRRGADDFVGFRPYRPGDSPRNIAWKAFAREQGMLVKHFSGGEAPGLWLTWDSVSHLLGDEARLSQLCRWVLEADANDRYYGLKLPGCELPLDAGTIHRNRCLEALALFGTEA